MFRALFRLVLIVIVLVAVGGFLLGWWATDPDLPEEVAERFGTTGAVTAERACEVGAEVGEWAAVPASALRSGRRGARSAPSTRSAATKKFT